MMTRGSPQGAVEESGTKRKRNVPTPKGSPLKPVVPVTPIVTNAGKKKVLMGKTKIVPSFLRYFPHFLT